MTRLQIFKKILPSLLALVLAAGMTAASELLHNREILFPEITAIAIGALAAPVQPWHTSRLRLLLTITAAAVIGVGLVVFLPAAPVFKVPLALLCAVLCVTVSGTQFLPAVSACVLPVLMGTRSPVYIGSVVVMTSLILLLQHLLEQCGLREKQHFVPIKPDRALICLRLRQILAAGVLCILPVLTGEIFFVAPPLIVAFFELSSPGAKSAQRLPQVACLLLLGAVTGVLTRFVLSTMLGLPLTVPAVLTCALMLLLVSRMGLYFPPCGAIATLPFLIPEQALVRFPFEIAAGTLLFIAAARAVAGNGQMLMRVRKLVSALR